MRVLRAVPNSVLWLYGDNPVAERNLRREAQARGVDANRLVFAPRTSYAEYLARLCQADLFLDTLPYNAGATASDALWAGVPVLTCVGRTFVGRMAGSLLNAVGLPELVTDSLTEYEALALRLATDTTMLDDFRGRLVRNRDTSPLFDTDRFRRHMEAAYLEMWRLWEAGEGPKPFAVPAQIGVPVKEGPTIPAGFAGALAVVPPQRHVAKHWANADDSRTADVLAQAAELQKRGLLAEAEALYRVVLASEPENFNALHMLGVIRYEQGRHPEAIQHLAKAVRRRPQSPEAHYNLGLALFEVRRYEEAVAQQKKAIELRADFPKPYNALGNALAALGRYTEAIGCYQNFLKRDSRVADPHNNLGNVLRSLGRYDEAAASFRRALEIKPDYPLALGNLLDCQRRLCDWTKYHEALTELVDLVRKGALVASPFNLVVFTDDPALQLTGARLYTMQKASSAVPLAPRKVSASPGKIRLAYLSADFHDHATSYLIAELIEKHDRSQFEVFGFSFGPAGQSAMRTRLNDAFDRFFDVSRKGDRESATLMAELGVHIAIDLKGYTLGSRPGIMACRPAPVQVQYLGRPVRLTRPAPHRPAPPRRAGGGLRDRRAGARPHRGIAGRAGL